MRIIFCEVINFKISFYVVYLNNCIFLKNDLSKEIKSWKEKNDNDLSLRLKWFVQIADAIHFLHTLKPKKIIHRDIKPQ